MGHVSNGDNADHSDERAALEFTGLFKRFGDNVAVDHRLGLDGAEQLATVSHGSQAYPPPWIAEAER